MMQASLPRGRHDSGMSCCLSYIAKGHCKEIVTTLLPINLLPITMLSTCMALLTACAAAPPVIKQGAWTDLPHAAAPVQFALPGHSMKIARVRRTQLNSDGDLMTETSFAERGRGYPTVTFLLQTLQGANTVFVSGEANQTQMRTRVVAAVGNALASIGVGGEISNQNGPADFLGFSTNRSESCVAIRQYLGEFKPGTVVDGKELLGSQVVLVLYCVDQDATIDLTRIKQILNGYTLAGV